VTSPADAPTATRTAPGTRDLVPFREATRAWFAISLQTFGGPAGQIAVMQRTLVDERRWIGQQRFLHALNHCMLLPGPEAQQLAIYIGWLLHRTWGGIVAGAVAFVIIVLVVGFLLFRRQRRKNKEARKRGAITGGGGRHAGGEKAKPFQSVDSDNDTMSVDPLMMLPSSASPSPPHMHRPSPGLDSRISGDTPDLYGATSPDETPSSFAGGFQPVGRGGGAGHPGSTRHPSWDSATNNDTITSGYFDAQYVQRKQRHQRLVSSETGGVARTVSRMTHDSRPGYYGHGRDVSDASDASSSIAFRETEGRPSIGGATPTLVAELEAQPYVAELPPNSPASVSMLSSSAGGPSPIDPSTAGAYMQYHNGEHHRQRQRSSSGGSTTSVGSVATTTPGPGGRPPLVHQRKRSDGRAGTGRLGVVDEEMIHGYHGPREFLEGQTAAESPLTEIDEKSTK